MTERERTTPAVEEVAAGVWALPLPMPGPLRHVYAYAVALEDGMLLIDAGPDSDAAFAALEQGLRDAGGDLADVRGVLFTHAHPDHHGGAARLRERAPAWHALHAAEAEFAGRMRAESRADGLVALEAWLAQLGAAADETRGILEMVSGFAIRAAGPPPDRLLADGDRIEIAGGELVALHTPGHAPGHLCFVHPSAELVFTGDHVLSPTTPNVSISRFTIGNPLADYLAALARIAELGDILGLPGHQDRVAVAGRAHEIAGHHETQLDSIVGILGAGGSTVREVAGAMRWSGPWDSFGPGSAFMALGEALAHLAELEARGLAERTPGTPVRWALSDRGRSPRASRRSSRSPL